MISTGAFAPDFTLPDLDGLPHSLSGYRGRLVIVYFWSAECQYVQRIDPELLALLDAWGDPVSLLPVASNANEPPELLRQVASERGLPRLLHDRDQAVAGLYGAQVTPHFFVIDSLEILRYQGAFDDVTFRQRTPTRPYLRQAVASLLSGRLPDPSSTPPYGCSLVRYAL